MFERKPEKNNIENKEVVEAKKILDYYFRPRLTHDLSKNLPENRFNKGEDMDEYKKQIPEHHSLYKDALLYAEQNPEKSKTSFIINNDANVGWKFHLNCEPDSAKDISKFLADNGYYYKYLSGGELEDGKVFTVYVGSHELSEKLAREISDSISSKLAKPVDHQEIEFAPGVIGRFVGPRNLPTQDDGEMKVGRGIFSERAPNNGFHQYGTSGFSILNSFNSYNIYKMSAGQGKSEEERLVEAKKIQDFGEVQSFLKLKELYGDYFFRG